MVALRLSNLCHAAASGTNRPASKLAEKLHSCVSALAIREKELGLDAPDVAQSLNDLGVLASSDKPTSRGGGTLYGEHLLSGTRSTGTVIRRRGTDPQQSCRASCERQNRHSEAGTVVSRSQAIRILGDAFSGRSIPIWRPASGNLNPAAPGYQTNRKDEALLLARRALAIFMEKSLRKDHPNATNQYGSAGRRAPGTERTQAEVVSSGKGPCSRQRQRVPVLRVRWRMTISFARQHGRAHRFEEDRALSPRN